jgi:hypothetical protein
VSSISDIFDFEGFALRDQWKKIKKDPLRMFVGAVDPASTKLWNKTSFGKDWEPLTDQWGGQYGGSTTTMGDTGEGVYGRAAAAGVPTKAGAGMHDIAHVIAAFYAGGYGADKLGGLTGADKLPAWSQYIPTGGGGSQEVPGQPASAARKFPAAPPQVQVQPRPAAPGAPRPIGATDRRLLAQRLMRGSRAV